MGIYASGQTYEQLILHLLAHPLPEARSYGTMILEELKAVMPSFVTRVERPERGGEWIAYLESRAARRRSTGPAGSACDEAGARRHDGPSVRLLAVQGDEDDLLTRAAVRVRGALGGRRSATRWRRSTPSERAELLADLVGDRANRRHRPGPRL